MDRVSERDRSSRKTREERERERDADYTIRDREVDRGRKKHRHHDGGKEPRYERHRESERRHHSIDDSPPESDLRRRDRSPDRHRNSVERRNISRGDSPSDADRRARDSVERDRDGGRRHRRSSREDLENGGERKHERSSNKVRGSVEREGFSYEGSMERCHRKRKDNRGSDDEDIENNNVKRARVSDAEYRKSMSLVEDRDLEDVSVLSEDSKEGRRGNFSKDRRKEEIMVTDDDMKHRQKKGHHEMNGSIRHGRRLHDDADQEERLYAGEGKETVKKDRKFKVEVKDEKLERPAVAKPPVSSDISEAELKMEQLANANGDRSNVISPMSGSLAKAFAEEPLAVASKFSKPSSNSHPTHTKMERRPQLPAKAAAFLATL